MHSDELRALEQSFQDQLSALQLWVTTLVCRFHPASLRAAAAASGSDLSVVVGESLADIIAAQPSLLSLLWETLRPPIPATDLLAHSHECCERIAGLSDYLRMAEGTGASTKDSLLRDHAWARRMVPLSLSSDMLRSRASSRPQNPDDNWYVRLS